MSIDTRNARRKLEQRGKPYYRKLDKGLFLAYRRNARGGTWTARLYVEDERGYQFVPLGAADDTADPDGTLVLNYSQAQDAARRARRTAGNVAEPTSAAYRVSDAMADYLDWLAKQKRSPRALQGVSNMIKAVFNPTLGGIRCDRLTTKALQDSARCAGRPTGSLAKRQAARRHRRDRGRAQGTGAPPPLHRQ